MSEQKHTPTPWTFDEHDRDDVIAAGDDVVCRIPNHPENGRNWKVNAALIVEAVNNYESLRAQLASAKEEIELANQKREFAEFEWNRATEHAQKRDGQLASARKALQFIADGYENHDINHVDYRVKVYQAATEVLEELSK